MPVIPTQSDFETGLLRAVDELLFYVWDPIGINDDPNVRDEYYDYVPQVFEYLRADLPEGKIREQIMKYLTHVGENLIGYPGNKQATIDRLLATKDHLAGRQYEGFKFGPSGTPY
ncbi:MAG: hypothetical protein ACK5XS_11605 [Armatimonadota bacterium]|jgi:hypothetical protein|nr:hypothetical protein [Fimbriimonadaceae bacterium]MCZ8139698.1 hypothetical protein [Fimbriimonadaceae bacterium]